MAKGRTRSNPTALRNTAGQRVAGRNTIRAAGRRRGAANLANVLAGARGNNARNARRRPNVAGR